MFEVLTPTNNDPFIDTIFCNFFYLQSKAFFHFKRKGFLFNWVNVLRENWKYLIVEKITSHAVLGVGNMWGTFIFRV